MGYCEWIFIKRQGLRTVILQNFKLFDAYCSQIWASEAEKCHNFLNFFQMKVLWTNLYRTSSSCELQERHEKGVLRVAYPEKPFSGECPLPRVVPITRHLYDVFLLTIRNKVVKKKLKSKLFLSKLLSFLLNTHHRKMSLWYILPTSNASSTW